MEQEQAKKIIEALLFATDKPLTLSQIKDVLEELEAQNIKSLITQLKDEYLNSQRSFGISELAGGYQIMTHPEYAPWLKKLYRSSSAQKLSRPALETLAIIAYRQPLSRQEVEDIRGVSVDGVIRTLLDKTLLRISGRKQIPGRPFLYSTTKQFLELFGLRALTDLPKLETIDLSTLELPNEERVIIEPTPENITDGQGDTGGEEDGKTEQVAQEN